MLYGTSIYYFTIWVFLAKAWSIFLLLQYIGYLLSVCLQEKLCINHATNIYFFQVGKHPLPRETSVFLSCWLINISICGDLGICTTVGSGEIFPVHLRSKLWYCISKRHASRNLSIFRSTFFGSWRMGEAIHDVMTRLLTSFDHWLSVKVKV